MKNFFNKHCLSCKEKISFNICSCLRKHNVLFIDPYIDADGNCFLTLYKDNYYASFFLEPSCISVDLSPIMLGDNKNFRFEIFYNEFDNFNSQEEYLIYFNKVCDKFISNLIFI